MKILILNFGSSSIKYQVRDVSVDAVLGAGSVSRIGEDAMVPDHGRALRLILGELVDPKTGVLESLEEIAAVGHRVVHGGRFLTAPALITPEVVARIEECSALAPLHNGPALVGIREALLQLPGTPQVAVFDTAFHSTVSARAHTYALPYGYYAEHGIRRYGFHGSSFQYVSGRVDAILGHGPGDLKVVIAHLGNGASITAVSGGKSVDTSMGLTPLEGLVMGTRPGDVDPGVILYLMRRLGLSEREVDQVLNQQSGLLGVSGVGNDMRDVLAHAAAGDERCELAVDIYTYRVKKYIGAYAAAMGGLDALVFTAGIGENSPEIRAAVCEGLGFLGVGLDAQRNTTLEGAERDVSAADTKVRVLVIHTDEERLIAQETTAAAGLGQWGADG